jgi:hypothetical protein
MYVTSADQYERLGDGARKRATSRRQKLGDQNHADVEEQLEMTTMLRDLRGGARALLRSPTHTMVAVLTIALGIGLNTTMFTIVESVLLRPLPFRDAETIVSIHADLPGMSLSNIGFSVPEIDDLAARSDVFQLVTAVWVFDANLTGGQRAGVLSDPWRARPTRARAWTGRSGCRVCRSGGAERRRLAAAVWARSVGDRTAGSH